VPEADVPLAAKNVRFVPRWDAAGVQAWHDIGALGAIPKPPYALRMVVKIILMIMAAILARGVWKGIQTGQTGKYSRANDPEWFWGSIGVYLFLIICGVWVVVLFSR
jgi:hypothetical protein